MMRTIALASACLAFMSSPGVALAADWEFVGNWKLNVTCHDYKQVNNVSISEATGKRVLGTTNVDDGFGKIVGGSFDGENVTFTNKYKWDGHNYTEIWTGTLSKNGNYLRGAFTTNSNAGGCSFRGPRV